jgi:hypothetical protein
LRERGKEGGRVVYNALLRKEVEDFGAGSRGGQLLEEWEGAGFAERYHIIDDGLFHRCSP